MSRAMQWSCLTEEKHKNKLAQTEFRFIKTIMIIRGGNYLSFFASISALHCSKRRVTSRRPFPADQCSGVHSLKKSKRMTCANRVSLHINEKNYKRGGNYVQSFACISALHCSKRRVTSRWPFQAEICSGVCPLKEIK